MKLWKWFVLVGVGTVALTAGGGKKKKKDSAPPPLPDLDTITARLSGRFHTLRDKTAVFLEKLEQGAPTGAGSTQALTSGWATLCADIDEMATLLQDPALSGLLRLCHSSQGELERALQERDAEKAAKRRIITTFRAFIAQFKKANCEVAIRLLDTWTVDHAQSDGPVLLAWVRTGLHPGPEIWDGVLVIERKCQASPAYREARQRFVRAMGL